MTSLLLAAAISLSQPTDTLGFGSLGQEIRNTTVMTSSFDEFELISYFITRARFTETHILQDGQEIVIFFNNLDHTLRDTVLIREVNFGADERYKMYYKPQQN
jgi:hypothetical protein